MTHRDSEILFFLTSHPLSTRAAYNLLGIACQICQENFYALLSKKKFILKVCTNKQTKRTNHGQETFLLTYHITDKFLMKWFTKCNLGYHWNIAGTTIMRIFYPSQYRTPNSKCISVINNMD